MMNVGHENFGDIYIYIYIYIYISVCVCARALMVNNKIIWFNRNMENHLGKQCNHSPYGSSLAN
jgi:hypothetical protein